MTTKKFSLLSVFVILFMALVIAGWFFEKQKKESLEQSVQNNYDTVMKKDKLGQNKRASVDYYTLALSWSPNFCDTQKRKMQGKIPSHLQYQCGGTHQFGWVIHGLWPQSAKARRVEDHPRFCKGDLPELPHQLIEQYLPESPGAALLQGEWEKHGACAFDSAQTYFDKQKELFKTLVLPKYELDRNALFKWVKENNPALKDRYLGGNRNELFICYDKNWQPMNCPRTQFQ